MSYFIRLNEYLQWCVLCQQNNGNQEDRNILIVFFKLSHGVRIFFKNKTMHSSKHLRAWLA